MSTCSFLKGQFTSSGEKITGRRLLLVTIALMVGAFFGELDRQLLVTAIPKITTEFHSLEQAAWYQASHDLARLAFLPIFGRVYTLFPLKITYCANILVFIIGSVVCATSSTSHVLIVGRAIQGVSHAGTNLGGFIIVCHVVSKKKMPLFLASIILMTGVASAVGPPLGGIFAESSMTWRLGFYLSIAMALIAGCLITFTFPEPVRVTSNYSFRERLKSTDPLSVILILTSLTVLFLALEWGGTKALIPVHILTQRTVGFGCLFAMFLIMAFGIMMYYMPFYFQAARGFSPSQSGVYTLALYIPDTVVAVAVGAAVTYFGHYVPFMVVSAAMTAVGSGLFTQIQVSTDMAHIIGLELLVAFGLGVGIQLPLSAARNVLDEPDVPAGEALVLFCLSLGYTLSFPMAQAVFMNTLRRSLETGLSSRTVDMIIAMGPSKVNIEHMKEDLVSLVAESYGKAITTAFYMSIAASGLALIAAASMEWRKLEKEEDVGITGGVLTGSQPSHPEMGHERDHDASHQAEPIPLAPVKTLSSCAESAQRLSR
ncbi:hypothetical protein SLS63_009335 [Diaporthe eres]|uniref:Major facilitator superfamily (MFS) profile domain-containing protein n=1 Tax=Diaporthe eres TaxID=83184 RepID=A0ABR1P0B5_DIAER